MSARARAKENEKCNSIHTYDAVFVSLRGISPNDPRCTPHTHTTLLLQFKFRYSLFPGCVVLVLIVSSIDAAVFSRQVFPFSSLTTHTHNLFESMFESATAKNHFSQFTCCCILMKWLPPPRQDESKLPFRRTQARNSQADRKFFMKYMKL